MKVSDLSDAIVKFEELMSLIPVSESYFFAHVYLDLLGFRNYFEKMLNDLKYEKD